MTSAPSDLVIWSAAVNTALLGTDRAPPAAPASDGALGAASVALVRPESDAASNLLRVAAAASAYQRCGRTPGRTQALLGRLTYCGVTPWVSGELFGADIGYISSRANLAGSLWSSAKQRHKL